MNISKSFNKNLRTTILVVGIIFLMIGNASAQMKNDIKLNLNEKVLFTNCVKEGSKLYLPMEELALAIDKSISIAGPFELGAYFKFSDSKVLLIKKGSGKEARINVQNTGVLSSEVKIIILDGKKHAFIGIDSFTSALGGSWKYNETTGIYSVTAGGCGACLLNEK
ncbi:MAG: hypothetical protein IT276_10300 [Ignavibacteriaceae bacterium]|nr:hypothetical protein [Ignavibacterium sp.]MCC6255297.1 hypothetical protein [Ignavibacteriaceae bacterium]HRP93372.1 hypothetical protein [Ignavibacteriaceae bacterium]